MATALPLAALAAAIALYAAGTLRVWRRAGRGRGLRWWEPLAFAAGWAAIVAALAPPLESLADALLSAHMVQHELFMLVAAPLIVLGRPLLAMLSALPACSRRRSARWALAVAPGPLVAWLLHAIAVWLWHVPSLYELAARVPVIHALEHASFLGTAAMFWWALFRGPGARARFGLAAFYVFTTALHTGLLGVLLLLARRPWYAVYELTAPRYGLAPLEDQQLAGLIMWIPAGVLLTVAGVTLVALWLRDVERRQIDVVSRQSLAGDALSRVTTPHVRSPHVLLIIATVAALAAGCTSDPRAAVTLTGGDPERGREALRRYGCWTCHTIPGVAGANATVGPPLTGLANRSYVAGQPNTPDVLMRWIRHPQELRQPTPMPDVGVTDRDSRDIVAFLYTLR